MTISKLSDVDPTFREVVSMLYGDSVDPRELWDIAKSMPAGSDLHVPGMGGTPQQKQTRKRRALAGGLVLGTAAEGTATAQATKNAYNAFKKPVVPNIPEAKDHIQPKLPGMDGIKGDAKLAEGGRTGKAAAAGMLALQATNMGVGLASARELTRKDPAMPSNKKVVAKALLGKTKPLVRLTRPEQDMIVNRSQQAAKKIRRTMVTGAVVGGAAGTYAGHKRYALKTYNGQPTPVVDAARSVGADAKSAGRKAKDYGTAIKQTRQQHKNQGQITKADTYTWEGTISKVDEDKRLVFGWCSLSKINGEPVVDLQGDYIPIEETESAAYRYVVESRKGGDMHKRVSKFDTDEPFHTADLVESMVITPEKLKKMGLAEDALPHGWWIGMKVNDDAQWLAVKKGERLGFSVHGKGRREEREL